VQDLFVAVFQLVALAPPLRRKEPLGASVPGEIKVGEWKLPTEQHRVEMVKGLLVGGGLFFGWLHCINPYNRKLPKVQKCKVSFQVQ
jgi:hypothetical protein